MRRRFQESADDTGQIFGMAWFMRDEWAILKQIADDSEGLHDTFEDWLISATLRFNDMRAEGLDVRQVYVKTDDLVAWCRTQRLKNVGSSRARYVTYKLHKISRRDGQQS